MRHPSLTVFDALPRRERWFCRARLALAPLELVASRAMGTAILDVGCGHGVLAALLLHEHAGRRVVGIDPDERKIAWAQQSVGRDARAEFHACTIEQLAERQRATFDCVFIADVLCLVARTRWPSLLAAARTLLKRGGQLVVKDAENDGSWRARKALWQERLMVHVLRRTVSTGGIGFATRAELCEHIDRAGFRVTKAVSCAKGYSAPHVLVTAEAR